MSTQIIVMVFSMNDPHEWIKHSLAVQAATSSRSQQSVSCIQIIFERILALNTIYIFLLSIYSHIRIQHTLFWTMTLMTKILTFIQMTRIARSWLTRIDLQLFKLGNMRWLISVQVGIHYIRIWPSRIT